MGSGKWKVESGEWRLAIEGGFDGVGSALEDVGVDHGGFYVFVPQ